MVNALIASRSASVASARRRHPPRRCETSRSTGRRDLPNCQSSRRTLAADLALMIQLHHEPSGAPSLRPAVRLGPTCRPTTAPSNSGRWFETPPRSDPIGQRTHPLVGAAAAGEAQGERGHRPADGYQRTSPQAGGRRPYGLRHLVSVPHSLQASFVNAQRRLTPGSGALRPYRRAASEQILGE